MFGLHSAIFTIMSEKIKLLLFLILPCIWSCQNPNCHCDTYSQRIQQNDRIIKKAIDYYKKDSIQSYWNLFNEPELFTLKHKSFRFHAVYLGMGKSEVRRISYENGKYNLHLKEFMNYRNHPKVYGLDSLISYKIRPISNKTIRGIEKQFSRHCFWTMPSTIKRRPILDGTSVTLEIFDPELSLCTQRKYHPVHRLSPDSSSFTVLCDEFFKLDPTQKH